MHGDFVVDDGLVAFADDVDSEFLSKCKNRIYNGMGDTRPSGLSRSSLMKVPFELLMSLMKIY